MKCYHGTTYENYLEIIKNNGFEYTGIKTWNCSEDDSTYFYTFDKVKKYQDLEEEANEYITQRAIESAFESARISASVQKSTSNKIIVLELEIDDDLLDDDFSCPNMDNIASFVMSDEIDFKNCLLNVYKSDVTEFPDESIATPYASSLMTCSTNTVTW